MKSLLITLLVAPGIIFSGTTIAATSLSNIELSSISGGGIDPHLEGQTLTQEQQQPGNNNSSYTPPKLLQKRNGMELTPDFFAILQSSIDVKRKRKVHLNGMTQQGAQALNLENVLSSDTIATNNVFHSGTLTLNDVTTGIEVNQINSLYQLHRTQGYLDSSVAGHRYEKIVENRSGSESYDYHVYSNVYIQRRSSLTRTDFTLTNVQIGNRFTSLDEFTSSVLPLEIIPAKEFDRIFDFPKIGGTLDAGWFGEFGATLDYTGIQFTGPGLSIDSIYVGGNENKDLVLGTSITTPKLDFGDLDIKACVSACVETNWDLGFIGGSSIHPEFILKNLAPEVEELNLGTGIAFNGIGQVTSNSGNFTIDGDIFIKVTPYASLTLDFSKLELLGVDVGKVIKDLAGFKDENGDATNILTKTWSFDIFNETLPFELLNEELNIAPVDIAFGEPEHVSDEVLIQDNDTFEVYKSNDIAESSFNESYEHTISTGGQMTGAQAELLALSEGNLSVDNSSNILLTESAQKNMRVFNGVNAVASVAANALNISRSPSITTGTSAVPRISMQQHNRFIQQR